MKGVKTYTANIYVGLKPNYDDTSMDVLNQNKLKATAICQKYCDDIGLGLTLTDTTFIYTKGNEPGLIVGLINYPRFPAEKKDIREKAIALARNLLSELNQQRLSVVFSDSTIMLERDDNESNNRDNEDGDQ